MLLMAIETHGTLCCYGNLLSWQEGHIQVNNSDLKDMSLRATRICGLYPCHADHVTMPMRSYNDGFNNVKPCKFNMRYKFIGETVNGRSYLMSNILSR